MEGEKIKKKKKERAPNDIILETKNYMIAHFISLWTIEGASSMSFTIDGVRYHHAINI